MASSFDPRSEPVDISELHHREPIEGDHKSYVSFGTTNVLKKGTGGASVPCASSFDPEDPFFLGAEGSARSERVDISELFHAEPVEGDRQFYYVVKKGTSGVTAILVPVKGIEATNLPSILVPIKVIEVTKLPSILVPGEGIEVTNQPSILVPGEGIEVTSQPCAAFLWDRNGSKVEEIMVAVTGQAAISLMGYYLNSSTFSAETLFVVGANALGFVGSLSSLLLREKCPRAALVLCKIGAVGASSAMVTAMTMFVPANHNLWVSCVACLLPAIVVAFKPQPPPPPPPSPSSRGIVNFKPNASSSCTACTPALAKFMIITIQQYKRQ